jgi:hypothetical protein
MVAGILHLRLLPTSAADQYAQVQVQVQVERGLQQQHCMLANIYITPPVAPRFTPSCVPHAFLALPAAG